MDRGEAINIISKVRRFILDTKPVINDYDSIENKEPVMAAILRDIDGFYKGVRDFKRAVDYFLSAYGYDKPVHAAITEIGEIVEEIRFEGAYKSVMNFDNRTPEAVLFRIICCIKANVRHYLKFACVSDSDASSVEDAGTPTSSDSDASSVEDAGTPTSSDAASSVEDAGTPTSSDSDASSVEDAGTPTSSDAASSVEDAASSEIMFVRSPYGLDIDEARKYFSRAIEKGFIEKTDNGFKWLYGGNRGQIRLGYFCSKVYNIPRPINALEEAFGVKKLSSSISIATECQAVRRADVSKWRDHIDSEIFFDL